ncbi:hypothetical protein ACJX0J_012352, partial [Zea mays]
MRVIGIIEITIIYLLPILLSRSFIIAMLFNSLLLTIGPGHFLVHHAIALGLHTTTLILVKGALDARGSKLMSYKKDFGYSFLCDGPGCGGTCDISVWDAFYLAVFWMLNTIGWVTFYWHWKHITLWQGNVSQFNESSTYLMEWLRDYLCFVLYAVLHLIRRRLPKENAICHAIRDFFFGNGTSLTTQLLHQSAIIY